MGLNTALCAVQMLSEAQKQFGEARRWVEQGAHLLASPQRKVRQHHAGKQSPSMTCNLTKSCHSLGLLCCCIFKLTEAVHSCLHIEPCWPALLNKQQLSLHLAALRPSVDAAIHSHCADLCAGSCALSKHV